MAGRLLLFLLLLLPLACGGGGNAAGDAGPDAQDFDGGADAATGVCDPVAQNGCGSAEKCSIVPSAVTGGPDSLACVDSIGTRQALEPCLPASASTPDDCAPGLACRGYSDPRCLAFCSSAPVDTCAAGERCLFVEDLDGDLYVDVEYCARTCDLLDQDCPGTGIGCYPTRDGPICAPIGAGDVPALEGDYCAYANSCDIGLGCFFVSVDWYCLRLCDFFDSGGPTCASGDICNRHEDDDWGVCISSL